MIIFKKSADLRNYLQVMHPNETVGIVPTMGALHEGHVSLTQQSKSTSDITIVSIFVNPTQFNEKSDLKKYPRTTGADLDLLSKHGVDIVYLPDVSDIYSNDHEEFDINLGHLDQIMEGKFRPGHFKGVAQVVYKLLILTQSNSLYMGQKDYQQIAVVQAMINEYDLDVHLVMCPIVRLKDGLAMSSRNVRLTTENRTKAKILHQTLSYAKEKIGQMEVKEIEQNCMAMLNIEDFRPEYFTIINGTTLERIQTIPTDINYSLVACTAVWAGEVRLIDNMILKEAI